MAPGTVPVKVIQSSAPEVTLCITVGVGSNVISNQSIRAMVKFLSPAFLSQQLITRQIPSMLLIYCEVHIISNYKSPPVTSEPLRMAGAPMTAAPVMPAVLSY